MGDHMILNCYFQVDDNNSNAIHQTMPSNLFQQNSQNNGCRNIHYSNALRNNFFGNNKQQVNKCYVVSSNLRWVQKLIIIPTKHRGCHDITTIVTTIALHLI
jgi:hypothetical protein